MSLIWYTNKHQCPYYHMSYTSFDLKNLNVYFLTKCTQYILFLRVQCKSGCRSEPADVLYILFLLCTSGIRNTEYNKKSKCRTNKLLTDKTKRIMQSIFYCLHMYANDTYRYFATGLRAASKNFSICPNLCTSAPAPLKARTFFEKSHGIRTARVLHLLYSIRTYSSLKNFVIRLPRDHVASWGRRGQNSWTAHL